MEEQPTIEPTNDLEKSKQNEVVKPKKKDGRSKPRSEAQRQATQKMLARKEEMREKNRKAKADLKEKEIKDEVDKRLKNQKKIEKVKKQEYHDDDTSSSSSDSDECPPPIRKQLQRKVKKKQPIVQYHNYYYGNTSSHQSGKSLRKFTSKEDWITRKNHKKCWKKFNQYGFSNYRFNFFTGEKIPK